MGNAPKTVHFRRKFSSFSFQAAPPTLPVSVLQAMPFRRSYPSFLPLTSKAFSRKMNMHSLFEL
jgi:hypothetical protein